MINHLFRNGDWSRLGEAAFIFAVFLGADGEIRFSAENHTPVATVHRTVAKSRLSNLSDIKRNTALRCFLAQMERFELSKSF